MKGMTILPTIAVSSSAGSGDTSGDGGAWSFMSMSLCFFSSASDGLVLARLAAFPSLITVMVACGYCIEEEEEEE